MPTPSTLSAHGLVQRFGPRSRAAACFMPALYYALRREETGAHDTFLATNKAWSALGKQLGIAPPILPDLMQRALETYYASVVVAITGAVVPGSKPSLGGAQNELVELLPAVAWEGSPERELQQVEAPPSDCSDPPAASDDRVWGVDLFQELYQALFPRRIRHALGEYYTPAWLADFVLREAGWQGDPSRRLLDPTCGSGAFLLAALRAVRAHWQREGRQQDVAELCRQVQANIVGFDVNPLAVLTARANYLIALHDWHASAPGTQAPVERRDVILDPPCDAPAFDFVVGNPPWIAWDHLPTDYRQATMPLWQQYGLFTLSANAARHGGGKKDLSMLLTYACADRYLRSGGRLGFVITQTVFQSHASGDGFRRFRLGADGPPLAVLRVDDMVALRPFAGAANWSSVLFLEKGRPTVYPVPYVKWLPTDSGRRLPDREPPARQQIFEASPVDPQRPGSPWMLAPQGLAGLDTLAGPSEYQAHLGANTGGANGVYWLEVLGSDAAGLRVRNVPHRGKHVLASSEQLIEPELVYPLVRWGDVDRWQARPSIHLLLVQDPATRRGIEASHMQSRYPLAYDYLLRFRPLLEARAAYRRYQGEGPFYAMYNVGPYTLAPWKVVWRRMDRRLRAAVLGQCEVPGQGLRPIVPQETCVLVAADSSEEAHYLCALLNSSLSTFLAQSSSVDGGKGFGTPGMLNHLNLRRFQPGNSCHLAIAECSLRAHRAAAAGDDLREIEDDLDRLTAQLAGLDQRQLSLIQAGLSGRHP